MVTHSLVGQLVLGPDFDGRSFGLYLDVRFVLAEIVRSV